MARLTPKPCWERSSPGRTELAGEAPRLELDPGVLPRGVHRPPSLVVGSGGGPFSITARTDLIFASLESFLRSFSKSPGVTTPWRWHSARLHIALVSAAPSSSRGTSAEKVFSSKSRFAADPTKVFAPALAQTYSTCHATRRRTVGFLCFAWGMSAARTRASVRVLAKSPSASSASPPSHVFSPDFFASTGTR